MSRACLIRTARSSHAFPSPVTAWGVWPAARIAEANTPIPPIAANERCLQTKKQIPAYALLVDVTNASAKAFYEHYGFTPLLDRAMTLYLPLGR